MHPGQIFLLCALVASAVQLMANAQCVDEEHMYECRAPDEEAEDLICNACYPDGDNEHYNCSCWLSSQQEPLEEVYLTCQDALDKGQNENGVYTLKPDHLPAFQAYCDMETDGGGWTVFQRRMDGSVEFYLNWTHYVHGFGNLSGEHWLGLSKIHRLANSSAPQQLRVDLEDFNGNTAYAQYSSFYIGGSSTDYTLHVTGYSGTAGDSLAFHHGSKFSTKDNDNDSDSVNCAIDYHGAWWYYTCYHSNLNGNYVEGAYVKTGVCWDRWKGYYSLKYTDMKVRP